MNPIARVRARLRAVWVDDRGLADTVNVMFMAVVVLVFVLLLVLTGRVAEARTRIEHSAESAAQAAALQRSPDAAHAAAGRVIDSALTNCVGGPAWTVDTTNWAPGGVVAVTITCRIPTGDLAPLPLRGSLTLTASSAAVIDTFRDQP
jgi:Flp pilus assembly protein TadG